MKFLKVLKTFFLTTLILTALSCTKSGSSSDGDNSSPEIGNSTGEAEARTNCGVVINSKLVNPISDSNGEAVYISRVADSNAFVVSNAEGGQILVKLHGISNDSSDLRNNAISFLQNYTGNTALFIKASKNCVATISGGGSAQVGQLILSNGESISESLIRTGFASASSADGCSSDLITNCFNALQDSEPITAGELDSFLWKPTADSDGRLAVHTGPYGTTVTVNGETGSNQGGGNGYGSLARFSKNGCAYGSPRITVRSSDGFPYTVGGRTSFTVPNACGRNCLEGSSIVACSK